MDRWAPSQACSPIVAAWHDYAAIWTPDDVTFFIDDGSVR